MKLRTTFLFDGVSDEVFEQCCDLGGCEERAFSKGSVLYDAHTAPRALAVVEEGTLRVYHGKVVMKDLHPGDVFGAAALYGSSEPYTSVVMAHTNCRVLFIPQDTVSAWMAAFPQIGENYVRFLSDRIRFLNRRLSTLTAGQTDGKLWHYLLANCTPDGVVELPSGMTGLAERLDMGRSSLYRSLDALVDAGRIRRQGKEIIVLKQEEET